MKNLLTSILLLCSLCLSAQCKDVFGNSAECPSEEDSLTLYNNAIRVVQFYDSNKLYHLTNTTKLEGKSDNMGVFEDLKEARKMFNIIRRELRNMPPDKFTTGKPNKDYKDITYLQYYDNIDEYRFYQRELENQIVNVNAPMSMYDYRIAPVIVNTYKCDDTASIFYNDLVNIPLYIPVVVKPFALLTEPEMRIRNKILNLPMPMKTIRKAEYRDSTPVKQVYAIRDTIQPPSIDFYSNSGPRLPVYLYNSYGSACVIGFMVGRKFKKLTHEQYADYAVSTFARSVLEDDIALDKVLRIKFGGYYDGLLQ